MKSHTRLHKLFEILLLTMFGVLMFGSQVIMAVLPNIELVSFLIILIARKFGLKSLVSIYIFVGLEALYYGLQIWVVSYLYVWAVLAVVTVILRKIDSVILFTLISALFGLLFGALCSVPYFVTGGFGYGISWIITGVGFDLLHCFGNLVLTFLLYRPLTKVLDRAL